MDFDFTPDQELLRRSVREFAEAELRPHTREWDEAQGFPRELLSKLAELGLMGIQFPEEFGGAAMSTVDYCICIEELARIDPSVSLTVAAHNGLGSAHIAMFGTEDQKRTYLTPLARGEKLAAWGLTEASAGSDAGAMRTSATREGDCWVLNGTKAWVTSGSEADVLIVMARTDSASERRGPRGISAFIVTPDLPGFKVGKKEDKMGLRASPTVQLELADLRVPAGNMLGREGAGFSMAMQSLDNGRLGIAAQAIGIARCALEHATTYAGERRQFGKPIKEFEAIQFKLADMATRIAAARALLYQAAAAKDRGEKITQYSSMSKLFASETAMWVTTQAIQIFGGYGYVKEYPVERLFRDAKVTEIYEGTSEIQRIVIARELYSRSP
jgi:alkylation response protein AidB-like acyl-CoA dehydrogenase